MGYKTLQIESYFPEEEITRYGFISHMESYIKQLLQHPEKASVDDYLMKFGINSPKALVALLKRTDPSDENSAVLIRTEKIKTDKENAEDGDVPKDKFHIKYKLPRKDYMKKMRNLYISMFENYITNNNTLNEGAWGKGILDNDLALDYQSEFGKEILNKFIIDVMKASSSLDLWARLGVMIDFLKKYKDDELQLTDEYTSAVMFVRQKLDRLYRDKSFVESWDNPKEMETKLKTLDKQLSTFLYEKNILNARQPQMKMESKINEDGEGGTMAGMGGATSCDASSGQFTQPLFGKPIKKKTIYITQEQYDKLREAVEMDTAFGDFGYDAPGLKKKKDPAYNHENMMEKSFKGE